MMDPRRKHTFTAIAGPTGSGKTVFVCKFVQKLSEMVDPVPDEIIYCYSEWQGRFQEMKGVEFIEGFPDMKKVDG